MATTYDVKYTGWDRAQQVVWYLLYLVEGLLTLRFILKIIGANPVAGFTNFIYDITQPLVAPFNAIIRSSRVSGVSGGIAEWSALIAIAVYALAAWALIKLFEIADADSEHVIDYTIDGTTYEDYRLTHRHPKM